jgi:rod shape-determining protein MreD|tara:strand:- start:308 stop:841 length:534 start_codon:yes stop_codon:yes gene_type:complete
MKRKNSKLIILLIINIVMIVLLGLINSTLSKWGVFLYLPGVFFFFSCICLDTTRGMIACVITGLFLDVLYNTYFGYFGFTLALFHIFGKEWLRSTTNNKPWRPVLFQWGANTILGILWYLILLIENQRGMYWETTRFISDIVISSIIIIPISFWVTKFNEQIINIIFSYDSEIENDL